MLIAINKLLECLLEHKGYGEQMFDKGESIKFEDFVALTSREKNANNLFEHLIKAVSQHGFDRVIFQLPMMTS